MLAHGWDDCSGDWRIGAGGAECQLYCDECGARWPATPELRKVAIDENIAGSLLRRLADEGASLNS